MIYAYDPIGSPLYAPLDVARPAQVFGVHVLCK